VDSLPAFHCSQLAELNMDDFDDLVAMFRSEATELLGQMAGIFEAQRGNVCDPQAFVAARRIAHNLRGMALTVGAQALVDPCSTIESELETVGARSELPSTQQVELWLRVVTDLHGVLDDPDSTENLAHSARARVLPDEPVPDPAIAVAPSLTTICIEKRQVDEVIVRAQHAGQKQVRLAEHVRSLQAVFDDDSSKPDPESLDVRNRHDVVSTLRLMREDVQELGCLVEELNKSICSIRMASPIAQQNRASCQDNPAERRTASARILVVDDSLIVRTVEAEMLGSAGYEVSACADGEEAWELLQRQQYDLLVCDVQMPKLDGFGLTSRIRASLALRQLPVILATGRAAPDDVTRGAQVGADGYIIKDDLAQGELLLAVRRLIEAPSRAAG
jgi:CheY-like chemotaxis protein/HPt (histidine-containing phosphotransfer) domain-containing protein